MFDIQNEVLQAEKRIQSYILKTPAYHSIVLSRATKANVFLKCENLQLTGAFKIRGALNKILSLSPSARAQGIVTASSGNHGAAVAYSLAKLAIPGVIFVPENAAKTKIANIRTYSENLQFYGQDCVDTEAHARAYARQHTMHYISPYNDPEVVAGQGTIGVELLDQIETIDAVFVPIGGGGLIAGIAGYLKSVRPHIQIIGCLPENSPVMAESIKQNCIVAMTTLPTLSDATAGGIEADSITFDLCREFVDDYVLVSEAQISEAIKSMIKTQHLLIEGAAGVALASFHKVADRFSGQNVVIVLSGANIGFETLQEIMAK